MSTSAFHQLLLKNADALRPFAISLTKDSDRARDLMQETLCRALANHDKYRVGSNIKAWLFTIMRNIFINNYRRRMKQNTVFVQAPEDFVLQTYHPCVSNVAEGRLGLKEVHYALYQLPGIFRDPFLLYFEGYKYHEVAHMLQEPLGTIKSRIHFARKQLRQHIDRY
jgi:RNA polymerase sigma factor (sigma-70 family)